jgi:hypothetical protein
MFVPFRDDLNKLRKPRVTLASLAHPRLYKFVTFGDAKLLHPLDVLRFRRVHTDLFTFSDERRNVKSNSILKRRGLI